MYSSTPNDDSSKEPSILSPPQPPRMATAVTNGDTTGSGSLSHSPIPWSSGVCDCCDDFNSCCLTCCCPCIAFGRIAEILDRGSTACGVSGSLYGIIMCTTGCSCLYSCFYRSKLRGQYFLEESPCSDCCVHWCCEECALCQEYRELEKQGLDLSMGWHYNMEKQRRLAATNPSSRRGMVPTLQFGTN